MNCPSLAPCCPSLAPCCPFTSPICRAHLLPSAPPLLLLLLVACLPRRSRGKRASRLLTQTWPIVNLSLALPLARMIPPPPLPAQRTCRMIPQGWMGRAVDALSQTCPLAPSTSRVAVEVTALSGRWAQPGQPRKVFLGKCWHSHSIGERC